MNNNNNLNAIAENYKINDDTLAKILSEMALMESAMNLNVQNLSSAKFDSVYNFSILKNNTVSKERYDSTLYYYSKHPEEYKLIYEQVLEKLNQKK
ncbi:MAG: DUF4296 domain-containing protein [Bacteroidetes bacterium]|nr:DUF4296 domain-containing protein [Bacteroidota bacterium]